MKSIIVTSIAASSLLAGLAFAEPVRYSVIDLGTWAEHIAMVKALTMRAGYRGGLRPRPRPMACPKPPFFGASKQVCRAWAHWVDQAAWQMD